MVAVTAGPATMHPRTDHKRVRRAGIELIDGVEGLEWTGEVFAVKPSAHGHHSALHVFHVAREVARLPVIVVGGVAHLVSEKRIAAFQIFLFQITGGTGLKIKGVAVWRAEIKLGRSLGRQRGFGNRLEEYVEAKICGEHESAAMIAVVGEEEIGHRAPAVKRPSTPDENR